MEEPFVHEDLDKAENRINWSLFGLLPSAAFREWFLSRLQLPPDAVLYPAKNVIGDGGSIRPDFVIKHGNTEETLGWVEVECGRDPVQLARFRRELAQRVIAIWGRPDPLAELSLEEIADQIEELEAAHEHPQIRYNARHLQQLIREALDGSASRSSKPAAVSAYMLETSFVRGLRQGLGDRLSLELSGPMHPGEIRAQTVGAHGFSLRVYSRVSTTNKSLSVLNQSGGRPEIRFPSREKMLHYLPDRAEAVKDLEALVREMGGDMAGIAMARLTTVPIQSVEKNLPRLVDVVLRLAG
ncbi:MAG: hypothetical protein ACYCX3_13050 [Thermoleophilia bacterium]